ncbi:uncharacterized protein MELLADRAFT_66695 [Melampsora larici-populina 98AG31]|uniref:G-patch domain-containing protein n=1 Tax=Melampsora larici-populina (strain 98AG31 / pathotype 3-4-7) TaxID=747676 RepID=F4S086_MELLP|nr:uncharacterized protein MELLADRAFT_66695 [Melampsora larici-populina 98AG31]EGG01978.1 hypothetical protein MELLADRAFT_66695 [Melampsora larici-populina 98AG31]
MAPTSQLKKRATETGMDNLDESFVKIGTALPALSSNKVDKNEFVPIWQQEVKDEKGRRRLHGAFTGGFSAGYFNTVGSKEGWVPAEFKSSRATKNKADNEPKRTGASRPEDFMDDEDLAELESRKELKTNSQFDSAIGTSSASSTFQAPQYDPLTGQLDAVPESGSLHQLVGPSRAEAALSDLIQPNTTRIGHKLMQKMGWRSGQGIGPRITFERQRQLALKLGVQITSTDDEDDSERRKHLFPPLDRPLTAFQPWPGNNGLGYTKDMHSLELDRSFSRAETSAAPTEIDGQTMPKGASFGLGALNDLEDDDRDIYDSEVNQISSDPRARRLLVVDEQVTTHRGSKSQSRQSRPPQKPIHQAQTNFSDGTRIPKGFRLVLSDARGDRTSDAWYPAPKVPESWEPNPGKVLSKNTTAEPVPKPSGHASKSLTAGDRGRLLGEKQLPKSVFDFISAKDKSRLENMKQHVLAQASGQSESSGVSSHVLPTPESSITIPDLPPAIAQAALRGFMPFSHDLSKQKRYQVYLQSQAGLLSDGVVFSPKPKPGESVDQITKELEGFAKSAMMFKPMSAVMASRFTSAASTIASGELSTPQPGLRQPVFLDQDTTPSIDPSADDASTSNKVEEELSQAAQAVRMDMFGMLTRTTSTFYPQKLLCKRLNVPNPYPHGEAIEIKPKVASNSMSDFMTAHGFLPATIELEKKESPKEDEQSGDWVTRKVIDGPAKSLDQVGLGDDDTQGRDILTTTRPAIDLFKAIFADESEDETAEEDQSSLPLQNKTSHDVAVSEPLLETNHSHQSLDQNKSVSSASTIVAPIPSHTPKVVDPDELHKLASFRPTFLRKGDKDKDEETSSKKKNKGKKRKVLMSFEDDEVEPIKEDSKIKKKKPKPKQDESIASSKKISDPKDKHRMSDSRKTSLASGKRERQEDLDDEWVEKTDIPEPKVLKQASVVVPMSDKKLDTIAPNRRVRASDLMDD